MRSFIALFALLVACTPHPHALAHPATVKYTIVINDGDFTEKETLAIAGAAQDWVDATYGLEIEVRVAPCYEFNETTTTFCVHAEHGEGMVCSCHGTPCIGCAQRAGHHIELDRWAQSWKQMRTTAAHEIGHAMGLPHDVSGNVMAERLDLQKPPTCRDVHAFWWLRHERGQCRKS